MSKIDIELAAEVIRKNENIDAETADRLIRAMQHAAEQAAEEQDAEKEPRTKKQLVIAVRACDEGEDTVGWVLQMPENDNPNEALRRIGASAGLFNQTKRGYKHPAKTFAEACEVVSGRYLKPNGIAVKTKIPVTVLVTDNSLEIPADVE